MRLVGVMRCESKVKGKEIKANNTRKNGKVVIMLPVCRLR